MFLYFIDYTIACCTTVLRLCNFFQHIHVRLEHSNRLFKFFDFREGRSADYLNFKCTTCHGSARIDQAYLPS